MAATGRGDQNRDEWEEVVARKKRKKKNRERKKSRKEEKSVKSRIVASR